jgi:hypothetical protein
MSCPISDSSCASVDVGLHRETPLRIAGRRCRLYAVLTSFRPPTDHPCTSLDISDVGASFLKPLFITGAVITAALFVMILASERLLGHKRRLLFAQRKSEEVLSYYAIGGATLSGIALVPSPYPLISSIFCSFVPYPTRTNHIAL